MGETKTQLLTKQTKDQVLSEAERKRHSSLQTVRLWRRDAEIRKAGKENVKIMLLEKVTFIIFWNKLTEMNHWHKVEGQA